MSTTRSPRAPQRGAGGTPPPSGGGDGDDPGGDPDPDAGAEYRHTADESIAAMARIMGTSTLDGVGRAACMVCSLHEAPDARPRLLAELARTIRSARAAGRNVRVGDVLRVLDVDHIGPGQHADIAGALDIIYTVDTLLIVGWLAPGGQT